MNNKENYKKAIDNIHVSEKLKQETLEKIYDKKPKNRINLKFVTAFATVVIMVTISSLYNLELEKKQKVTIATGDKRITEEENEVPRFSSLEQLKEVIKENVTSQTKGEILISDLATNREEAISTDSATSIATQSKSDYSTTNVQTENVDEADIVKTDGEYIYYVKNNNVYIVNAKEMELVSKITSDNKDSMFYSNEIFINNNKLIILGNYHEYENVNNREIEEDVYVDSYRVTTRTYAQAIVYDITDKQNPKQKRVVSLDGYYTNSRMIGDNIYFITNKHPNYYKNMEDIEILPIYKDTATNEEMKRIQATDIVYFPDTKSYSYMLVAGFNINNNEEVNIETFFGASNIVYASQENLYITYSDYREYPSTKTMIYKFNLDNSKVKYVAKTEIIGNLNNQFSMDEYEGNLRVATTLNTNDTTTNQLFVLDKELNQIGKIENMAQDEKIYSVRFIGKTGYIVTFKQIDPLFVIDLSEPTNPQIKGELKIPGYSSYLHPYDENHIIGIGYNTKTNKNGGVSNTTIKMSMFDVSDLSNPKEMFNVSVGDNYSYSSIMYNHKQLFYKKSQNLIGFPVTIREDNYIDDKDAFIIYEIDLENGFIEYGKITQEISYLTNIDRAIYIEDILYTLSESKIVSYDLKTIQKISEIELY